MDTKGINNNQEYYALKEEIMIRKCYFNATPERIGFLMIQCGQLLDWIKEKQIYLGDLQLVVDLEKFQIKILNFQFAMLWQDHGINMIKGFDTETAAQSLKNRYAQSDDKQNFLGSTYYSSFDELHSLDRESIIQIFE